MKPGTAVVIVTITAPSGKVETTMRLKVIVTAK